MVLTTSYAAPVVPTWLETYVMLDLFSEDKLVGRLKVAVKQASSLAGGTGNLTQVLGEDLAQTNLTGSGEDTAPSNALVGNVTDSNLAPLGFSHLKVSIILPPSRSRAVSFGSSAGAAKVDINDVFLTFHNALLHVARFPAESQMQSFSSYLIERKLASTYVIDSGLLSGKPRVEAHLRSLFYDGPTIRVR